MLYLDCKSCKMEIWTPGGPWGSGKGLDKFLRIRIAFLRILARSGLVNVNVFGKVPYMVRNILEICHVSKNRTFM